MIILLLKNNYNINAFFKDSVKNPEVGVLLMIIGDYNNSQNKKRKAILNPKYKYITVNSKFIGFIYCILYFFKIIFIFFYTFFNLVILN